MLVLGLAGAGKSTFSRALSARTGLPLIHLDVHYWKPGWVKPPESEWRDKQRGLRKPVGEMPEGCDDSATRRLRDEWRLIGKIWRHRRSEPEHALALISQHGSHVVLCRIRSKREARDFLIALAER